MSGLLIAPYNDSMRLGQGFNSFLQTPCLHNAVEVNTKDMVTTVRESGMSQVVSYSSSFVKKISDVVRSMNISAGSSIKAGSIKVSGSTMTVDEVKFASSDLNAVISVSVVNQTKTLRDDAKFVPLKDIAMDSKSFQQRYGDCYISGFIEGGDFHGIVSIKVLETSKKSEIKSIIKGQINGKALPEFTLNNGKNMSAIEAALSKTETSITVNWSGGGHVKGAIDDWSLDTVFKVASTFPEKVANCPQKTWAILTKYDNNRDFLIWAQSRKIQVYQYANVKRYASDLLDTYMEYKNNLARIQSVLTNPKGFKLGPGKDPVNNTVEDLVEEKTNIKRQMSLIVNEIDALNLNPETLETVERVSCIQSPEVWATRLPVPIVDENVSSSNGFVNSLNDLIKSLPFDLDSEPSQGTEKGEKGAVVPVFDSSPPSLLCSPEVESSLLQSEREFLSNPENRKRFSKFRFDMPVGCKEESLAGESSQFWDCIIFDKALVPESQPQSITGFMEDFPDGSHMLQRITTNYSTLKLTHGNDDTISSIWDDFGQEGKQYSKIDIGASGAITKENDFYDGIAYFRVGTTDGEERGSTVTDQLNLPYDVVKCTAPFEFPYLKGFYGRVSTYKDQKYINRLGVIWGQSCV